MSAYLSLSLFAASSLPLLFIASKRKLTTFKKASTLTNQSSLPFDVVQYWLNRDNENKFLIDVLGEKALDWVRKQNTECLSKLNNPENSLMYPRVLSILESKDKIPYVRKIGDNYYNFWQDSIHKKGILRRTTFESYKTSEPVWEVVLDIDLLSEKEGENWVYKGYNLLEEEGDDDIIPSRVLLSLSRGGADATVIREYDLHTREFIVTNGFNLPEAKSRIAWKSRDMLLVGTDLNDGVSMTDSGYPRVVREWNRGTDVSESKVLFEGEKADVATTGYIVSPILMHPNLSSYNRVLYYLTLYLHLYTHIHV